MTGRLVSATVLACAASLLIAGSAVGIDPAVTIVDPAAGAALDNPTPQISGTATDGGGDVTVEVRDAGDGVVASFVEATAGGNWLVDDADWAATQISQLGDGSYTVKAMQSGDSAGPQPFMVDTANPTGSPAWQCSRRQIRLPACSMVTSSNSTVKKSSELGRSQEGSAEAQVAPGAGRGCEPSRSGEDRAPGRRQTRAPRTRGRPRRRRRRSRQ